MTAESCQGNARWRARSVASAILGVLIFFPWLARGAGWKRWPEKGGEFATSIAVPSDFVPIHSRSPLLAGSALDAPLLLNARFRSPDRKVEFAVTIYHVRFLPADVKIRRIAPAITPLERVVERKSVRKRASGEMGDYWLYDEEMTVSAPSFSRYLLNAFSTGPLPGAVSILWELQAADENARKRYAPIYKRFKESLEIEPD